MQSFLVLAMGLVVGVISGVVGIGGGIFIVPGLVALLGMTQHRAQGTSLGALLAPIGLLAFWEYRKAGNVDGRIALLIAAGFLIGGWFGGDFAQQIPEVVLRRIFAVMAIGVGIKMLF
jgi:uncharacterized membrane protein YfcA